VPERFEKLAPMLLLCVGGGVAAALGARGGLQSDDVRYTSRTRGEMLPAGMSLSRGGGCR